MFNKEEEEVIDEGTFIRGFTGSSEDDCFVKSVTTFYLFAGGSIISGKVFVTSL